MAVVRAVRYRIEETSTLQQTKIKHLKKDILNGPKHIFGVHKECKQYFCNGPKSNENNVFEILRNTNFMTSFIDTSIVLLTMLLVYYVIQTLIMRKTLILL